MPIQRVQPAGLSRPAAYSQVVRAGNTVYIAGQTAQDDQGQVVGMGDARAQAVQVYENLKKALAGVGGTLENLVKITVYITDARFRTPVSEVRAQYLGNSLPASTLIVVAGLAQPEYLLEIEAIAIVD